MAERMPQSMEILKHVLMADSTEAQQSQLDFLVNTTKNASELSMSSVLAELMKTVSIRWSERAVDNRLYCFELTVGVYNGLGRWDCG